MPRIISGKLRGRKIPISPKIDFKPSTSKVREAIFNIISAKDSYVLDLFCGSGSLGLEALSRGAKYVTFIDINLGQLKLIQKFIIDIKEQENTDFLYIDVLRLPIAEKLYDIVLIDPPYFSNLINKALEKLQNNLWLANNATIIIETSKHEDIIFPESFELIDKRIYGNNKVLFIKYATKKLNQNI